MFFVSRHKFHRIGQRARRAPAQRLVACNNLWSRRTSSTGNIFPCSALSLSTVAERRNLESLCFFLSRIILYMGQPVHCSFSIVLQVL